MNIRNFFIQAAASFTSLLQTQRDFVYVALGDSTVEGIGASHKDKSYPSLILKALQKRYKNAKLVNLGKGGARVKDVINNQLEKAIAVKPDIITISIGGNDIFYRTNEGVFEKDLQYLLHRLKTETKAMIVINTIPDMSLMPVFPVVRMYFGFIVKRFNRIIERQSQNTQVICVDVFSHCKHVYSEIKGLISGDGLHPSDMGYSLWALVMVIHIEKLLQK